MVQLHETKRFDPETRREVRAFISHYKAKGYTNDQIASLLNANGRRRPDGTPCDGTFVSNQFNRMKKRELQRRYREAQQPSLPLKPKVVCNTVGDFAKEIVNREDLDRSTKLKVLNALL